MLTKPALQILALALLVAQPAGAEKLSDGANHGGGGSDLVSHFHAIAERLLKGDGMEAPFSYRHRTLLMHTLRNCSIVPVAVLKNPVTKLPIENQGDKIAWGSPGLIQLKTRSNEAKDDSWEEVVLSQRPIAHHVIHELFRCSGAYTSDGITSPDDGYQISLGQYKLQNVAFQGENEIGGYNCSASYVHEGRSFEITRSRAFVSMDGKEEQEFVKVLPTIEYNVTIEQIRGAVRVGMGLRNSVSGMGVKQKAVVFDDGLASISMQDPSPDRALADPMGLPQGPLELALNCRPLFVSKSGKSSGLSAD